MKALVYQGRDKPLSLEKRSIPRASSGELVLRVKACGICGSDIHAANTGLVPTGTVMGHEFSGIVSEIGADVRGWQVGDRAISVPVLFCNRCENCENNNPFSCLNLKYIGVHDGADGAYADYVRVQAGNTLKIDEHISLENAALWEPLAVAYRAFKRARINHGDSILIVGGGAIGQSIALVAKSFGINYIGLSEMQPERLERGSRCGANVLIDAAREQDPVAVFTARTHKVPKAIFECVGLPGMFQRVIDMAPKNTHLVFVGVCMEPEEISVLSATAKELTCSFSLAYEQEEVDYILEALAIGTIDPTPLITKKIGFQEFSDTFEYMKQPNADCKVLFMPDQERNLVTEGPVVTQNHR